MEETREFYSSDTTIPILRRILEGDSAGYHEAKKIDMPYEDFVGFLKVLDSRRRSKVAQGFCEAQFVWNLEHNRGRDAFLRRIERGMITHRIELSVPRMLEMVRAGRPEDVHAYLTTMEALLINFPVTK